MKKIYCVKGLVNLSRANNSVNGNPKYNVYFHCPAYHMSGKTATDASFCYVLPYSCTDRAAIVEYHYTAGGRVVFDNIKLQ